VVANSTVSCSCIIVPAGLSQVPVAAPIQDNPSFLNKPNALQFDLTGLDHYNANDTWLVNVIVCSLGKEILILFRRQVQSVNNSLNLNFDAITDEGY
jgi:hypothetical protein